MAQMEDVRRYRSKGMIERRANVLRAARRMIAALGIDGFTMKELAAEAGVSTATLFNIYGSRDRLINEAVFDAFYASMEEGVSNRPDSLEGLNQYIEWTCGRIVALDAYIAVVAKTYFSQDSKNALRQTILAETVIPYVHYLRLYGNMRVDGGANVDIWAELMANQVFACITDWVAGRLDHDGMSRRMKMGVFAMLAPLVRAPESAKIAALLDEIG